MMWAWMNVYISNPGNFKDVKTKLPGAGGGWNIMEDKGGIVLRLFLNIYVIPLSKYLH